MHSPIRSQRDSKVLYNENAYAELSDFLKANNFSKIFIFVDSNTHEHCLAPFLQKLETDLETEVIEIEPGEENKNIETCMEIWKSLSELGADRKSLFINLGGGVITDLGGFVAATFKRGISFINFPTSLLAMVDASVGGKTGVNLDGLKNQIGVIHPAEMVVVDTSFLSTLPVAQMRSGLAEMLKHGLIKDEKYWKKLISLENLFLDDLEELIKESIEIKQAIVEKDPQEENIRKSLNFGHTFGHAIESYFLKNDKKPNLLHGEAVAAGMVLESYISQELLSFPPEKLKEICRYIFSLYGKVEIDQKDRQEIISFLKYDKKNESGNINFVLLREIGEPVLDCHVSSDLLERAFQYYIEFQ
ncbi:MAG TPA: 3-dehydroquinate synthase [Salinimicrobium sp.]|nr:3-dehydroquinate synthase [Salinimicrobium sp.]